MSLPKTSASCVATVSGMRASSVAAKSEERIVPLPRRSAGASGAVSMRAPRASPLRSIVSRVNWVVCCSALSSG